MIDVSTLGNSYKLCDVLTTAGVIITAATAAAAMRTITVCQVAMSHHIVRGRRNYAELYKGNATKWPPHRNK